MKFNSFEEFLELYSILDTSYARKKGSSLVDSHRKRVDIAIPFEPLPSDGYTQKCLRIRSAVGYKETIERILFECLFGDPRLFQWFTLFELLNSVKLYSPEAQALYDLVTGLTQSYSENSGTPLQQMMSNMSSLRKKFGKEIANELAETFRTRNIMVPSKRDWSSDFIVITSFQKKFRSSPEVRRIGVGYKDKGSLPPPGSEYDPEPLLLSEQHCPINLWKRFRNTSKIKFKK